MQTINWFLLAALVFCFASWVGNWSENTHLRDQLAHKEEQLEKKEEQLAQMHSDHVMAMNAAAEAIKVRKEITDYERQRMCAAEKALGKNSAYCDGLVPDDVLLLWKDGKTGDPYGVAGGH